MFTMKELLRTAEEIAEKMKEKGYEYFNIRYGEAGSDFKTGIASYLHNANFNNTEPIFPIFASSAVAVTSVDNPYTRATFKIVEDAKKSLRVDTMSISMHECYDGALRTSLELNIKSLDDIPSRKDAAKLIEEKWEKLHQENRKKWNNPVAVTPKKSKGRKL